MATSEYLLTQAFIVDESIFQLLTFLLSGLSPTTCFLIVVNVNAHTSLVFWNFSERWQSTGLCLIPVLIVSSNNIREQLKLLNMYDFSSTFKKKQNKSVCVDVLLFPNIPVNIQLNRQWCYTMLKQLHLWEISRHPICKYSCYNDYYKVEGTFRVILFYVIYIYIWVFGLFLSWIFNQYLIDLNLAIIESGNLPSSPRTA